MLDIYTAHLDLDTLHVGSFPCSPCAPVERGLSVYTGKAGPESSLLSGYNVKCILSGIVEPS